MKIKTCFCLALSLIIVNVFDLQAQHYNYNELFRVKNSDDLIVIHGYFAHIVPLQNDVFFLSDMRVPTIYKFNNKGEKELEFGGRGRGPGEFIEMTTMYKRNDDEILFVIDRMNIRVTSYDSQGNRLNIYNIPEDTIISPWMGKTDANGNHYFLYRTPVLPNQTRLSDDHLIHVYSKDFDEKLYSFLEAEKFADIQGNHFVDALIGGPTTGLIEIGETNFFAVPYLFRGKVFHYELNENRVPALKQVLESPVTPEKAFEQIRVRDAPDHARVINTARGSVAGLVYNESAGIVMIDERYLVVFTYHRDQNYYGEFGYLLFNYESGGFLRYESIEELSDDSGRQISPIRRISYSNGKFYFVDNRGEEPEIVVAEIVFDLP